MSAIDGLSVDKIYSHFYTKKNDKYNEEYHCKLLVKVMLNKDEGCHSAFCVQAMISESTFYKWLRRHELLAELYSYCRMIAKQLWYEEGRSIRDREFQMGTFNYSMEHWKLIGWAKFGISKNSRIKININAADTPAAHYQAILLQASEGDFTAAEFKQLMEAVNVGLNVHQVFELQRQLDELKSDLIVVTANTNVQNNFTDKRIAQKD